MGMARATKDTGSGNRNHGALVELVNIVAKTCADQHQLKQWTIKLFRTPFPASARPGLRPRVPTVIGELHQRQT